MDLMDADIRQDYIQRYLDGTLDQEELIRFENELNSNSLLKDEFNLVKVIHSKEKNDLKDFLSQDELRTNDQIPTKRSIRPIIYGAVAMIAIILGTVFWMNSTVSKDDLLAQEIRVNNSTPVVLLDVSQDQDLLWNQAIDDYLDEDYVAFVSTLESIESNQDLNAEQSYFLAISYLRIGESQKAKDRLLLMNSVKDNFSEEVQWYLALTHLQLNENSEAKRILVGIASSKSFKWKQAEALLETME